MAVQLLPGEPEPPFPPPLRAPNRAGLFAQCSDSPDLVLSKLNQLGFATRRQNSK